MRSIGKFFVSLSKFVINLAIIYLITRIIEYTAQLLNFYIPFEFTFILLFIFYLLILKILKLKSFSSLIFERFDKYKVHITSTVIIFLLILIGNEVVKAKKVFDVVSYYSNYSHSKPDYTNRDSSKLVEVSTIDSTDEQVYINCLSKNEQPPLDYVLNKINQHQLLIFGEMHDISDNLIFLNKIIPDLYNAGVRVIAMEVCQSYDDGVLEKLINGKEYDRNLALEIARHQPWLMWGAKDYWDVLESVWKLNNSLKPNQEKMEIIGLESDYDMPSMVMVLSKKDKKPSPFYEKFRIFRVLKSMPNGDNRDELMAKEIEEKIIKKNKKGIVWVGADHSFPNYKWNPKGRGRMGYILNKKFGDKIFQIYLHNNFHSELIAKFIDNVVSKSNFKQVGFDVINSPFGLLRDSSSSYFKDGPMIDFSDIASGYLYLCPIDSLKHCEFIPNFVTQEIFIKEKPFFEAIVGKPLKNADEVNEYFVNKFNE